MLLEALTSRSRRGLLLSLAPAGCFVVLLVAMMATGLLPRAVEPPLRLALIAIWAWWTAATLPGRARAMAEWLRERVLARGGEPDPAQPIVPPTTYEINARAAPRSLQSVEHARLSFMRHPGAVSRHMLALAGAGLGAPTITTMAIADAGWVTYAAAAMAAGAAGLALADLYRGRRRALVRPWRTRGGPWPVPWDVEPGPPKLLGPVWVILGALLFAATMPISGAPSVVVGVDRGCYLVALALAVWEMRHHIDGLVKLEATRPHGAAVRLVQRLAPIAWYLLMGLQASFVALGLLALALTPIDLSAAPLGVLLLALGLMVRTLRSEWRRPTDPVVIDSREVAVLLSERHLEHRVTLTLRVLTVSAAAWFFIRQAMV